MSNEVKQEEQPPNKVWLTRAEASWRAFPYDDMGVEQVEYVGADLLATVRREEREAAFKEAEAAIQAASLIGARYCSIDFLNGAHWGIQRAVETVQGIISPSPSGSGQEAERKYMHEDELPEDMPQADYDEWYKRSFVLDGVGGRVGPKYP